MPVAKPSQTADWANTAASPDIVAPSGGKQSLGWIDAEFPPHNFFNWWQNLVGKWTDYLNDLANQVWTWTAAHTFQAPVTMSSVLTANGTVTVNASLVSTVNLHSTSTVVLDGANTINGATTFTTIPTITPAPAFTYPSLINFANISGHEKFGYWIDIHGVVHLQGSISSGGLSCGNIAICASLPHPAGTVQGPVVVIDGSGNTFMGQATISTGGALTVYAEAGGTPIVADHLDIRINYHPAQISA